MITVLDSHSGLESSPMRSPTVNVSLFPACSSFVLLSRQALSAFCDLVDLYRQIQE